MMDIACYTDDNGTEAGSHAALCDREKPQLLGNFRHMTGQRTYRPVRPYE
jgi:hypothetical protein